MTGCNMERDAMHSHLLAPFIAAAPEEPASLKALRAISHGRLQAAFDSLCPAVRHIIAAWSLPSPPVATTSISHGTCLPYRIVSINGHWPQEVAPIPGISFFPLSSLKDPYTSALHASWNGFTVLDDDPLSLLASASYQDAFLIVIPPDTTITSPLHVHYVLEPHCRTQWAMPRLHISIGRHSSFHVIETSSASGFLNTHLTVDIEEGGSLVHTRMDVTPSPTTCSSLHATVKNNASFTSLLATATPLSRHTVSIFLAEQGASATLRGLSALPPHQRSYLKLFIDHQAPHTFSSQLFKGIVAESGLGSFESKVLIRQEAQKGESQQHSHFLTLGEGAQIVNKPCFDIFADDVIAAHGATSGTVDQEALFYLNSRGLSAREARSYLIEGFCEDIIRLLPPFAIPIFSRCILDIIGGEL
jgi:Fe-S cluster assembly protein SufD